jgi:hypothetical protein
MSNTTSISARRILSSTLLAGVSTFLPHAIAQTATLKSASNVSRTGLKTADIPITDGPDVPAIRIAALELPATALLDGALPDAPSSRSSSSSSAGLTTESTTDPTGAMPDEPQSKTVHPPQPAHASNTRIASRFDKYIAPEQAVPRLTGLDKLGISAKDTFSIFTLVGAVVSAGYSHVTNGTPNYGTNSTAFAQRVGAAAARDATESLFADGVLSTVLHEDPRYYELGKKKPVIYRAFYAATRTVIGRTDSGHRTINFAELGGYFGSSELAQVYYPPINQGQKQVLLTFGGALGGDALGRVVSEFSDDLLEITHLKRHNPVD